MKQEGVFAGDEQLDKPFEKTVVMLINVCDILIT